MKMKRMALGLALVSVTTAVVSAADRTWDGGGNNAGDVSWSAVINWDGDASAPVENDALFFGGLYKLVNTNDLTAGTSFAGITFSNGGAFALGGNGITLGGDVRNLSTNTQTLSLPMSLSGTRTFYGVSRAITANGVLSGAGGLLANITNSTLTLTGNNTYDGVTVVSNGTLLAISHSSALGSTNGNTVVRSPSGGWLQLSGGITVAEPLTLNGERPNYGSSLLNSSGSNTLSGLITRQGQTRLNSSGGTTLVITGGMAGPGGGLCVINSSGTISFYNTPLNIGSDAFYTDSGGLTVVGVAGNTWGETLVAGGTLRMDITNGLPAATVLRIGIGYSPSGTLNLNGFDQTVGHLKNDTINAGTRVLTSPTPATLTVNQSVNSIYDGQLTGALNLTKIGAGMLTLSNSLSTTTGNITVTNGTLLVALASSLGNSTNVTVTGGTLELRTAAGIADTASLAIADGGAKVKIGAGLTETVGKLFLGGLQQGSGTWGSSTSGASHTNDAYFAGTGRLMVLSSPPVTAVNATWDAEGADTFTSTTNNWAGDVLPAFDGTTYAVFGTGGSTATVDTAVSLYGMAFTRDGNFTVANGNGSISLGAGGLAAAVPNTTSRAYTLAEDLTFAENQVWSVTNNGAGSATLTVSGSVGDGASLYGLAKFGNGVLVLSGSNSYDGATLVKTGGVVRITHANSLGSTNGTTVVEDGGWVEMSGGIRVAESFALYGDASIGYAGALRSTGGSNTLSGLVTSASRIRCTGGSLDIIGGISSGGLVLGADGGTFIRVSEKPINIGGGNFYAHTGSLIILAVTNNVWGNVEISGNYLRTDVDNALAVSGTITLGSGNPSGVDLNGRNNTIGQLISVSAAPATRIVYSTAPATLTVTQNVASVFNGAITGRVSLVKTGSGALTLAGTNTTYGSYIVSNGTLTVSSTGTLGLNSTNIVVGGTGTLALSNSVTIANSATVRMPDSGTTTAKISLGAGVNEEVGWLFYGTKMQRVGTYGSTNSTALFKDATHFSGAGVLTVLHDKSGTLIMMQ